jgi:hypothetical protein
MRCVTLFGFMLAATLAAGCGKTRVYSGPTRPDREVSTVFFHATPAVSLSAMTLDGVKKPLSANGYSALPGRHSYSVRYDLAHAVVAGSCDGDFTSEGGKEYVIDVAGGGDSAFVSVYTNGRRELVASGDCR